MESSTIYKSIKWSDFKYNHQTFVFGEWTQGRAESRLAPSQWDTSLQRNAVNITSQIWVSIGLDNGFRHFELRPSSSVNGILCLSVCLCVCLSVCLSVRLSVCLSVTPFWLWSHHRIIMKFSGVITTGQGNAHAKGQGRMSKVKVTEVTTQVSRFRTVTPVWIHIWWWNDIYSLLLLRRGALLLFKVIRQSSRSHGAKDRVWPRLGVSGL